MRSKLSQILHIPTWILPKPLSLNDIPQGNRKIRKLLSTCLYEISMVSIVLTMPFSLPGHHKEEFFDCTQVGVVTFYVVVILVTGIKWIFATLDINSEGLRKQNLCYISTLKNMLYVTQMSFLFYLNQCSSFYHYILAQDMIWLAANLETISLSFLSYWEDSEVAKS